MVCGGGEGGGGPGNTAFGCTAVFAGVGKHLHTLPTHPTLWKPQVGALFSSFFFFFFF